jgi:tetratricopeptide (TPR) repeat protein
LYATALVNFQKAIAINPKVGLTYYYLGQNIESTLPAAERSSTSSQPTENDRKLLQAYGTALTLDPGLVPAYVARANIQTYLKHPNLALNDYDKAIELHPKDHELYNRRAQLLMDNGRDREAIADFGKAIDNCKNDALLQAYHEQRADVSLRVGQYDEAVRDYSETIRLLLQTLVPGSLGLKQFRRLYPESNGLTDERLSARLHALLRPAWDYDVFAKSFVVTADETSGLAASFLSENYAHRGDAYWLSKDYRKAILDYQRIFTGLPKYIKEYPDAFDRWKVFAATSDGEEYIDVRTVDYSQPKIVKLWVKTIEKKVGKPPTSGLREAHINCGSRMIDILSVTNYDVQGKPVGSVNTAGWETILPDTLGEALYDGMCKE